MKKLSVRLDDSTNDIFEFCCTSKGLTKSEQVRDLIKNFIEQKPIESTGSQSIPKKKIWPIIDGRIYDGKTWHEANPDGTIKEKVQAIVRTTPQITIKTKPKTIAEIIDEEVDKILDGLI